jgi:endonuclease YncB( thermonuclease family)
MAFHLIKGTFHVKGYRPDGDSIRFKADNPANWDLLGPGLLAINSKKHVQLRLEGIDTLETHFSTAGGEVHQPHDLADAATDFLLQELNITGVVRSGGDGTITQANDGTPGYILSRQKDSKAGRPVSFVFAGAPPAADGSSFTLKSDRLKESLNYRSVVAGHAYPTYYQGLFSDLRNTLTEATAQARSSSLGLYPRDKTTTGVAVNTLADITETHPILPKLFRRLAEFAAGDDTPDLSGFKAWLAGRDPNPVLILSTGHFTHFDNLIDVQGQTVRLIQPPENLVFTP